MLADQLECVKAIGLQNSLKVAWRRVRRQRAQSFSQWRGLFAGSGLEIGGPSRTFENGRDLPVYPILAELDNCLLPRARCGFRKRGKAGTFVSTPAAAWAINTFVTAPNSARCPPGNMSAFFPATAWNI